MSFGRYRLLSQLGAGRDGARYRAADRRDGRDVEVRLLSGLVEAPERRAAAYRRLRTAALIDHPTARRVVAMELEGDSALIVLEWAEGRPLTEVVEEGA